LILTEERSSRWWCFLWKRSFKSRSAAYATRHIAKNLVAAGVADEVLVQVSYAIGVAEPCGLYINTYGTAKVDLHDGEIAKKVSAIFDLRPYAIEQNLKLRNPIYQETASYGHMGKEHYVADKTFNKGHKNELTLKGLEFFTWEKLDKVEEIKAAFGI
jgi:S-adenosylmethionine synthetase